MKLTPLLLSLALLPTPAWAASTLDTPIERQPCTTITLPNGGTACVPPKVSQRFNAAPRIIKLGDTIRTQLETNANRICHGWGGTHLIARPDERKAWDCFKVQKTGWY